MKRTFTLLLALAVAVIMVAEKPLSKKNLRVKSPNAILLKSTTEDYQPLIFITDYWNGSSWTNPQTTNLKYYANGLLWISESPNEKTTYAYYDDQKLKEKIIESFDGANWINNSKYSYAYDDHGNLSQMLIYYWESSDWVLSDGTRNDRIYDVYGEVTGIINYYYDYPEGWCEVYGYKTDYVFTDGLLTEQTEYDRYDGTWIASWKNTWWYDDQNKIDGGLEYFFNGTNFDLKGRYININWYLWDPQGHVQSSYVETYTFQEYTGPAFPHEDPDNEACFVDAEKLSATYPGGDGGGTPPITIETYQIYNQGWVNDYRWTWMQMADYESELDEGWSNATWMKYNYTKDFQTDGLVYNIKESYKNGTLIKASKDSKIFDGFGNQTELKNETHNGDENWIQQSGEKWIYNYDAGTSKVITRIYQDWNSDLSVYINNMRQRFEYISTYSGNLASSEVTVFPTVFRGDIIVQSGFPGKIFFYNLSGVKMMEKDIDSGNNLIHAADLKKGYYILKAFTSDGESVYKMLKY